MSAPLPRVVDVVVVGGGPVGACAALRLADAARTVLLVEPQRPVGMSGLLGHDLRVFALSPASLATLGKAGVAVPGAVAAAPYQAMEVWDAWGRGRIRFEAASLGVGMLGAIVEFGPLVDALWQRLERHPGVHLAVGDRLAGIDAGVVRLASGSTVAAEIVVGADGPRSAVRQFAGGAVRQFAPAGRAVVTTLRIEADPAATAWQCFTPVGPLAFLPLPAGAAPGATRGQQAGSAVSIVWSVDAANAERLLALPDEAFRAEVARAMDGRFGAVLATDRRVAFDLQQQQAARYVPAPGVVLVGDAAHVVLPLAGQGANLGFGDVEALCEALARHPEPAALRAWEQVRQPHCAAMIAAMAAIEQAFALRSPVLQALRNAAVRAIDRTGLVKDRLARTALGLA